MAYRCPRFSLGETRRDFLILAMGPAAHLRAFFAMEGKPWSFIFGGVTK